MSEIPDAAGAKALSIDPAPTFEISPYLYMQFMEPLGATDGSVEAAWDFLHDSWRKDLVRAAQELAPTLIRWPGGCLTSYYRWKEGVGPREQRKPMLNLLWGGVETNQVGTHEFVDFCRLLDADPLLVVNFESDGRRQWAHPPRGGVRSAGPDEAAAWVDYCNNPGNVARRRNGSHEPFDVRLWQIGNETSYDPEGLDCEAAALRTVAFAQAMRQVDPSIELIGWGDSGWAPRMLEIAGEHLQYIAFHHGVRSTLEGSPLGWSEWRLDPARTWDHLMSGARSTEAKIEEMRQGVNGYGVCLALTESHFTPPGRNRSDVLLTWAAGVANARVLNVHERNGDLLKIATLADFFGTRWTNMAIMVPVPEGSSYMLPVGQVMSLYGRHVGERAVAVTRAPEGLDVTASRSGQRFFLHVVNTRRSASVPCCLVVSDMRVHSGCIYQIALDPMTEADPTTIEQFAPTVHEMPADLHWRFPPASVSVVELLTEEGPAQGPGGAS
jgi:hypothetical protein